MAVERESRCVCTIAPFVYHTTGLPFSLHIHTRSSCLLQWRRRRAVAAHPSFIRKTGNYVLTGASTPLYFFPLTAFTVVTAAAVSQRRKNKISNFFFFFFNILCVKFRALKKKSLYSCPHFHYLFVFMYRQSKL